MQSMRAAARRTRTLWGQGPCRHQRKDSEGSPSMSALWIRCWLCALTRGDAVALVDASRAQEPQ